MQRAQEEEVFSPSNLAKYYFRKIFRYMPLNIVALLTVTSYLPTIGSGPIWNYYDKLVGGCDRNMWTNILWINNLYPSEYDDKCLPWTWFIPCYIQLSLIVPPTIWVYKKIDNSWRSGILFFMVIMIFIIGNFIFALTNDYGATIAMISNDEFFSKVFMNPLFHFSSFFYGILMSLTYIRFRRERGHVTALQNSFPSRMIELIRHN
jgi:peptidoglycan/LPS O-acetylase OafA/YrhL